MTQGKVEEWCRKRKKCWNLPVDAFGDAIMYDNWFRKMAFGLSRKAISRQAILFKSAQIRTTSSKKSCNLLFADEKQIQAMFKQQEEYDGGHATHYAVKSDEIYLVDRQKHVMPFKWEELDLTWSYLHSSET